MQNITMLIRCSTLYCGRFISGSMSGLSIIPVLLVVCICNVSVAQGTNGNVAVLISGSKLQNSLDIANEVVVPVGVLLKGGFTVQNISKNIIHMEYKAEWFDEFKMLASHGVWQRFSLHPNAGRGITSVSKSPEGRSLVVTLRLPDDGELKGKYSKQATSITGGQGAYSSNDEERKK